MKPHQRRTLDVVWALSLLAFLPLLWAAGSPEREPLAIAAVTTLMVFGALLLSALVLTVPPKRRRRTSKPATTRPAEPTVAFDFDGTLTHSCTTLAFLRWRAGPKRYWLGLLRLAPAFAAFTVHRDRARAKAALLTEFLAGVPLRQVNEEAARFAHERRDQLLRADAQAEWRFWRDRGAKMLIVTASPAIIIEPFGRALGADLVIGTELEVDSLGRLTGRLASPNCRGPEKVRRLTDHFGATPSLAAAYGDSEGDTELLAIAKVSGLRVFNG